MRMFYLLTWIAIAAISAFAYAPFACIQVREILAEKFSVDIEKYKLNIREFVDEIVSAGS